MDEWEYGKIHSCVKWTMNCDCFVCVCVHVHVHACLCMCVFRSPSKAPPPVFMVGTTCPWLYVLSLAYVFFFFNHVGTDKFYLTHQWLIIPCWE